jgi:PAS domain S-box-containing protein
MHDHEFHSPMREAGNAVAPAAASAPSAGPASPRSREPSATQPDDADLASTERKVRLGFAVALTCLAAVGMVSYLSVVRLNENAAWVEHTREVLNSLELLLATTTDSETAERGYVITGDQSYLEPYRQSAAVVDRQVRRLRELTADNRAQQQRLDLMLPLVVDRLANLRAVIELRSDQGFAAAQAAILAERGEQYHDRIRRLIAQMEDAETSLLREREQRTRRSSTITKSVIIGGGFLACAFVGLAVFAIRRDFVGRARAERALRDANDRLELRVRQRTAELEKAAEVHARLAAIVESSDDAVVSKTLDGIITSWNSGAETLFGYTASEAIGHPMLMLFPPERASEEPGILARIARGESVSHFETQRVRKDGSMVDVSVSISPIRNSRGEIVGASKIARDITERRLAERRLQAQLARLDLLQRITRAAGERQDMPSIFRVVLGRLEDQLPIDFGCVCLYDADAARLTITTIGPASCALAATLEFEEKMPVPVDGNGLGRCVAGELVYEPDTVSLPFPFPQRFARCGLRSIVFAPLRLETRVFGVLVVARRRPQAFQSTDCEFLKQLSEHVALAAHQAQLYGALQQAYDDLRQTQHTVMQQERLRALGQMASGLAHDINNAISPVMLYTDALLEREPDLGDRARDYLQIIRQAIENVADTVARMREFYRPREPQLQLAPVSLNRMIEQVAALTQARWRDLPQQHGIAIEWRQELGPDVPDIMGAEGEIRDALTNLVFNAVDAMPQGGTITLRTRFRQAEPGVAARPARVELEVSDTGLGMDDETRRRCIEPFYTTKGERGTGLGLPMVYGMVQRHSAELEIDSEPGRGTTVRLIFVAVGTGTAAEEDTQRGTALARRLHLLLVDDDPLLVKSVRDVLEGDGHLVASADGGRSGIDAFERELRAGSAFDLVITDLGMPYVDGRQVAAAVKAASPDTPVILLTGWGRRMLAEHDVPAHVDRVLSKPPRLFELRRALAELSRPRASRTA